MTEIISYNAAQLVPADVSIDVVMARFGPRHIASQVGCVLAAHATLDAFAQHFQRDYDAVLLACFGDPGIEALREICPVPAIGMAEAAMREAIDAGCHHIGVLTSGTRWVPMLSDLYRKMGLDAQLAGVRAITPHGGEIASDPDAVITRLAMEADLLAQECGAQAVILGGTALAGLAPRVQSLSRVHVLDSLACSLQHIEKLARRASRPRLTPSLVETVGLSDALSALLTPKED